MRRILFVLSLVAFAVACSSDPESGFPPGIRHPAVGGDPGTPVLRGDAGQDDGGTTDGGEDGGEDGGLDGGEDGGTDDGGITFDASEEGIRQFLQDDGFRAFPSQADAHAVNLSHGGVLGRVFVNPALATSMNANATVHPNGSIAVLEVYTADGEAVFGHSAMVKTQAGVWNFFQAQLPDHAPAQFFEGTGNFCGECHSAGNDFIRSPATGIPTP